MLDHERIQSLANSFCREEIRNFENVAKKLGIALRDFLEMNFPTRQYCFVTVNSDISSTYIADHLHYCPNGKEQDSFIRQVNKSMNNFLSYQVN